MAFWITSALLLMCAAGVVCSRDLVRAVFWLAGTLLVTAAAYVQLKADLLGALQVLLYTGGIVTLMLFAVLLTWEKQDGRPISEIQAPIRGAVTALAFFGIAASAILRSSIPSTPLVAPDSEGLGALFLSRHVLPFEALSVLLLAVMVGAITLARRRDP